MPRMPTLKELFPKYCAPPDGYVAWHAWAKAQGAHGLKQTRCRTCGRYLFPQEKKAHRCDDFVMAPVRVGKAKGLKGRRGRG